MVNTLVTPADLADFPGAPFAQSVVDAAVSALRLAAGWHIAPIVTETVLLDTSGGTVLHLPTLRLISVTEVKDLSGDTPVVLTDWRKSRAGMLSRSWWPCGFESVEVVGMQHGHTVTPPELFQVVAEWCQLSGVNSAVRSEAAGGESIAYSASGAVTPESRAILSRYTVPTRF